MSSNTTYRQVAWGAWCPVCHAPVGKPCTFGNRQVPTHEARVENEAAIQKAVDYVWALHLVDNALQGVDAFDIATGESRR